MRNDFRVRYPLWMMAFIVLLGVIAFGIHSSAANYVHTADETSLEVRMEATGAFFIFGGIVLHLILLTAFFIRLGKYNKENPTHKISAFSLKPPEYLEEDEGMKYITHRAVQKVYSFISWALPLFATLAILLPISRIWMIYGILLIALGQYWIYYSEVRKFVKREAAE